MTDKLNILIGLLEDPDPDVFHKVSQQIFLSGEEAIPILEKASNKALSEDNFNRINMLLSELYFIRIKNRLKRWKQDGGDLLEGITLITEIIEPAKTTEKTIDFLSNIRNEIWIELNNNLTALEKIRIVNHFFFNINNLSVTSKAKDHPSDFSLSKLILERTGSRESVFAAYSIVVRLLGLPIFGVDIPNKLLLTYLDLPITPQIGFQPDKIPSLFLISPGESGKIYKHEVVSRAISDIDFVYIYGSLMIQSCIRSGKDVLERQLKELLSLWESPEN